MFAHIMSIETHTVYAALYSLVFGVWNRCLCMRMSYFLWACEEWMSWAIPLLEPSASLRKMRYVKHNIYYCTYMLVQEDSCWLEHIAQI